MKFVDLNIYGIDWDDKPSKKKREKEKPFCEFPTCKERVSTEFGRPKPYCKDHVFENPYVKDIVKRLAALNDKEDRKTALEAFKQRDLYE